MVLDFRYRLSSKLVQLKDNDYKTSAAHEGEAEVGPDSVLQKMYLHFATQENLPHRVAYESEDFISYGSVC